LVRTVEHGSDDRIPEPSRHRVKRRTLSTKSNARRSYPALLLSSFTKTLSSELSSAGCIISERLVTQKYEMGRQFRHHIRTSAE
jgi:hypothetical protein